MPLWSRLWQWSSSTPPSSSSDDTKSSSSLKRPREDDDDAVDQSAKRRDAGEQVLLDQLTCPVCLCGPLLPPVRQCPNGHLLCDACAKMPACAKCPTCRAAPTNIRCLAIEKWASAAGLRAPCPHCGEELPFSAVTEHTATCSARPSLVLKSSLSGQHGPSTRSRARRNGRHEAPDLVLSPLRPIAIGRSSSNSTRRLDVRIHHSEVSRRHCEVGLDPTGAWIIDRSSNGTYLNGERIRAGVEVRLQDGDRITFLDRLGVEALPTYTVEAHGQAATPREAPTPVSDAGMSEPYRRPIAIAAAHEPAPPPEQAAE